MLMGGLSFLDATLTLPGIAGIILTIGMAVDANILIFDRIREEIDKGATSSRPPRTASSMALLGHPGRQHHDLPHGLILYKVGTGPVRGFAVTLMVGIMTSVFAALVVTRVLVHLALDPRRRRPSRWARGWSRPSTASSRRPRTAIVISRAPHRPRA